MRAAAEVASDDIASVLAAVALLEVVSCSCEGVVGGAAVVCTCSDVEAWSACVRVV